MMTAVAAANLRILGLLAIVSGCATETAPPVARGTGAGTESAKALQTLQLIDSAIPPAIAGEGGWNYERSAAVDLRGDGLPERVVLTARVELVRGRPAWDDGQPWQVYLEAPDRSRTYLYAQRLQLGSLDVRVTRGDTTQQGTVVLIEHLPARLRILEVLDTGSGPTVALLLERELDPRGEVSSPRLP
jgi:hypothetical protein